MQDKLVALRKYVEEMYKEPKRIPPSRKRVARDRWKIMAWQRWAAEEFLQAVEHSSDLYFASEKFAKMMDEFACKETPNKQMFSVAYDVAIDLESKLNCL